MRVTTVEKCQKDQGKCDKCGKEIKAGQKYKWWKFRYGGKRIRCGECPMPRQSELTQSKMGGVYAAQENAEDAIAAFRGSDSDTADDLTSALESAAEDIRSVGEEYRESAQNIEDGFNHRTQMCDDLEEKADALDSCADELESATSDFEDFDKEAVEGVEDETLAEELGDYPKDGDEEEIKKFIKANEAAIEESRVEKIEEARQEWIDEQASKAEDAIGNMDLP